MKSGLARNHCSIGLARNQTWTRSASHSSSMARNKAGPPPSRNETGEASRVSDAKSGGSGVRGAKAAARGDGDGAAARHVLRRLLAVNASASSSLPFSFSSARVLAFLLDPSLGPPVRASDDEVRACGCLGVAFPRCFLALLAPEIQARMVYLISPLSSHWFIALLLRAAAVVRFLIAL